MEGISIEVKRLLKENPLLELIQDGKKVKCKVTGHEMPCRQEPIEQHLSGKKYKRQLKFYEFDYDKYKPHIVPSEKKWHKERKQLFCKLTLRHLNRDPSHVLRHVSGRRYNNALRRWEECKRTGQTFHPRGGSRHNTAESKDSEDEQPSKKAKKNKKNDKANTSVDNDMAWKDLEANMVDSDDNEDDNDSLADLYPAEDFEGKEKSEDEMAASSNEDNDASGSEFEDDEEIPEPPAKKHKSGQNRKQNVSIGPQVKKGQKNKKQAQKSPKAQSQKKPKKKQKKKA